MRLTLLPFLPLPLILALPSPISPDTHHLTPRQSDPAPGTGAGAGAGAAAGIASALSAIFAPFAALSGSGSGLGSGSSSSGSGSGFGSGSGSGGTIPTPARPPTDITYAKVAYADCGEGATGSNVLSVLVGPCEGGSGAEGSPCVFTQGRNYTIVITYTSPVSVPANQSRTGLASYDGDQRTAYSGQSFSACSYTDCPITAGVERNYTYPFRTFAAPNFQKLVFNATIGIQGQSFMCARVPVAFQPSS